VHDARVDVDARREHEREVQDHWEEGDSDALGSPDLSIPLPFILTLHSHQPRTSHHSARTRKWANRPIDDPLKYSATSAWLQRAPFAREPHPGDDLRFERSHSRLHSMAKYRAHCCSQ
jgi:hypothetical protein